MPRRSQGLGKIGTGEAVEEDPAWNTPGSPVTFFFMGALTDVRRRRAIRRDILAALRPARGSGQVAESHPNP
ncbi:MAG TPA: hypothetical protein VLE27_10845 [Thermoanaerobaculia bacterium]|nr:hypothetical protein [Thermoanaerobaculia bacterium]